MKYSEYKVGCQGFDLFETNSYYLSFRSKETSKGCDKTPQRALGVMQGLKNIQG